MGSGQLDGNTYNRANAVQLGWGWTELGKNKVDFSKFKVNEQTEQKIY